MKLIKSILLFLAIIMSLGMVNAQVTDEDLRNGTQLYYTLDDNFITGTTIIDSVGNYNGTNNGATCGVAGIINEACSFDGVNDYIDINLANPWDYITISTWINANTFTGFNQILSADTGGSDRSWQLKGLSDGNIEFIPFVGGSSYLTTTSGIDVQNDGWNHIVVTFDGEEAIIYINGVQEVTNSGMSGVLDKNGNLFIGQKDGGVADYFNGSIDEPAIWNKALNVSEVQEVYNRQLNNVTGAQWNFTSTTDPVLQFQNISVNNQTLINNTFFSTDELNFTTQVLNTSTNGNVNQTYTLSNLSGLIEETQFATNNVNGSFELNLSEGIYNISFCAENNETTICTSNYPLSVDLTPPTINNTLPAEINTYNLGNISNYVQCNDVGMGTCTIEFQPDNVTLNITENYTFQQNGNQTYMINATDDAGNSVEETGTILVNPRFFAQFNESGNILTNLTFGGRQDVNGLVNYTIYNDGLNLGNNTLLFEKQGYISQNFTFNLNTTSNQNFTFDVNTANIVVNIYNRDTGTLLNTTSVLVSILGLANQTTNTGIATFQNLNFAPGNYSVQGVATNYYTEAKDFTYSGEDNVSISLYLLDTTLNNSATLYVPVTDEWDNIISGANTKLLEYDPSIFGFKEVSQCFTDSNGECKFLVEQGEKTYIITTEKEIGGVLYDDQSTQDGEVFQPEISGGQEILGRDIIRALKLKITTSIQLPNLFGLSINAPDNENETIQLKNSTNTIIQIPVSFSSSNNVDYTVCLNIERIQGSSLTPVISPICSTGSAGILPISNISLNNEYSYRASITIEYQGSTTTYQNYFYLKESSLFELLKDEHYVNPAIMWLWSALLGLALSLRNISVWVYGAWTLAILQTGLFPGVIFASANVLIILINAGVLYLSKRQGDTR